MIYSKIKERLYHGQAVFSFEFFPPKTENGEKQLKNTLTKLSELHPDFVSVTYGAGGTTREKTKEIVLDIHKNYNLEVMPHLTCIGHSCEDIDAMLKEYAEEGISNILALRGDKPKEGSEWQEIANGPDHAIDIVRAAAPMKDFTIGVAGFPEVHPDSADLASDIRFLKEKVDAGADFIITQLFFDNELYFNYVKLARKAGITIPIIPGIMPVTKTEQLERFKDICGCSIQPELINALKNEKDPKYVEEIGLAYCAAQCTDLLRRGAPGIHLYTLNQSRAAITVRAALQAIGYWCNRD